MTWFVQASAAIYLASGVGALLGLVLPAPRLSRGAVFGLAMGIILQGLAFATLHQRHPVPSLTDLPQVMAFTVWIAAIALLAVTWRLRLGGLVAVLGPVAFLAVFFSGMAGSGDSVSATDMSGGMPHAHILLSSAGLGLLGISGMAGLFYLLEDRRLKNKRAVSRGRVWPSLEALDRVGLMSLTVGFALLTLGLLTGAAWVKGTQGQLWTGSTHAMWTLIAWGIFAGLSVARFAGRQGARQAAATALGGFAFLLFAVLGVEVLR